MYLWLTYSFTFAVLATLKCTAFAYMFTSCKEPALNTAVFPEVKNFGGCELLRKVCADDGMLVLFDHQFVAENLTRTNPYGDLRTQTGLWNFPSHGGSNSDALVGHQPGSYLPIRSASRMEASPHLQRPEFSACTLPVIIVTDWPYNMGEVFAQLMGAADVFFRQKKMIDDSATLVLATPDGLGAAVYHHVVMSPYSKYPLISFDDISARPAHEHRVPWSAEGVHINCFERAVLCKLHGFPQRMVTSAEVVLEHIQPFLPVDPLGFDRESGGVPVSSDTTLRVLIEARGGPARNLKNLQQLLEACEAASLTGFKAGVFNRISCKVLHTGDTPALKGVDRYYATVASVRSAHVLVAVHGAGAVNSVFLESGNGGTALLEIRPCKFGTKFCGWPNNYMQAQLSNAGHPIRFFALNVDDPQQCHPSDFEAQVVSSGGFMIAGEDMRTRDQHITLRPGVFMAMLIHVGSILRNTSAWDAAAAAGRLHGLVVEEGLVLGPLCVSDVGKFIAEGATIIRV